MPIRIGWHERLNCIDQLLHQRLRILVAEQRCIGFCQQPLRATGLVLHVLYERGFLLALRPQVVDVERVVPRVACLAEL